MRDFRWLAPAVGALLVFTAAALAEPVAQWKTVSLDNNPGLTIDVPASVGKQFMPNKKDRKQGVLMSFALRSESSGGLFCHLSRSNYNDGTNAGQNEMAAKLASPQRGILCGSSVPGATELLSASVTSNEGFPAGICAVNFTDPDTSIDKDHRGEVSAVLAIAAPGAFYEMTCEVRASSQYEARTAWKDYWLEDIAHVQSSLSLPPAVKK